MNAHEKTWPTPLLVETNKKFIGWVFVDPCGSIHRPPIQTRTEGARNSGVFVATNMPQLWADSLGVIPANFLSIFSFYGVIHGDFPDAVQFVISFWFLRKVTGGVYLPNGK